MLFSVENPHDGKTFENYTRFEWGVEVGVVTTFMLRLFVPHEFDMFNILLTIILNLKTVPPINDMVRLGELRVLFNITFCGHQGRSFYPENYKIECLRNFSP